jgi:MOSC domain-containing protein YiiM
MAGVGSTSGDTLVVHALFVRPAGAPNAPLTARPEEIFVRHRVDAGASVHCSATGFADSLEWHREDSTVEKFGRHADCALLERSVMLQSVEHYAQLRQDRPQWFGGEGEGDTAAAAAAAATAASASLPLPCASTFGENILVSGADCASIAVGDIFVVEATEGGGGGAAAGSPLTLEVTSPRKPCARVDRKHGAPFGVKGARRFTLTQALAGWFCRVLVEGPLREGQRLVRKGGAGARPHPQWTLQRVSSLLYGGGARGVQATCDVAWDAPLPLLRELCALPQLGGLRMARRRARAPGGDGRQPGPRRAQGERAGSCGARGCRRLAQAWLSRLTSVLSLS